jgi:hypothetical protein
MVALDTTAHPESDVGAGLTIGAPGTVSALWAEFARRAGLDDDAGLRDVVEGIRNIPYGRPTDRTPAGVVAEWRGTCSTKHELLARFANERWPDIRPRIVHRVYTLTPTIAARLFGESAAGVVPVVGIVDVHTYMTIDLAGRTLRIDATVPGAAWNGRDDMDLACGDGRDVEAGDDPAATKAMLVGSFCDVAERERVIAALANAKL